MEQQLTYRYDAAQIVIRENKDGADTEFVIELADKKLLPDRMKEVERKFEENRVHTDVLFYAYEGNRYKVIVREDYYVPFVLALMEKRLLTGVEWA